MTAPFQYILTVLLEYISFLRAEIRCLYDSGSKAIGYNNTYVI